MNITDPRFQLVPPVFCEDFNRDVGIGLLRMVERFARISHRSEEAQTAHSWERFLTSVVLQKCDWSVTEHEKVTVEFVVDRGITHEMVRHRIGAYTQESTRFVNYTSKKHEPAFINPLDTPGVEATEEANNVWLTAVVACDNAYRELLRLGATPQIARSVLPNALASKIAVTYNLRMWRHFFLMRTTLETHPQMKEVTIPVLKVFKEVIPLLYDDIEPNQRQAHNLRLPK